MTCAEMDDRLDAWVDGTLPEAERPGVEHHLSGCPSCREDERRTRELLVRAAALPRSLAPPRDLWPGISRDIERRRAWSWPRVASWQPVLAVAAAVIVAVGAAYFGRPDATPIHTVVVPSPGSPSYGIQPAAVTTDPVLATLERDYQDAANALLAALRERGGGWSRDPGESGAQPRGDRHRPDRGAPRPRAGPGPPELSRMLISTHRKRVDVLRRMVKLSTAL